MPVSRNKKDRLKHIIQLLDNLENDTVEGNATEQIIYDAVIVAKGKLVKAVNKIQI